MKNTIDRKDQEQGSYTNKRGGWLLQSYFSLGNVRGLSVR